jgi:hypothetical protein
MSEITDEQVDRALEAFKPNQFEIMGNAYVFERQRMRRALEAALRPPEAGLDDYWASRII